MNIPDEFKEAVSDHLYHDMIDIYEAEEVIDEDGYAGRANLTHIKKISGNVVYPIYDAVKQERGEELVYDISISTHEDASLGYIAMFKDETYVIRQVIHNDSHNIINGNVWSSGLSA